jgi:hypothetical protein
MIMGDIWKQSLLFYTFHNIVRLVKPKSLCWIDLVVCLRKYHCGNVWGNLIERYMIWSFHGDSMQWNFLRQIAVLMWSWWLKFQRLALSPQSGVDIGQPLMMERDTVFAKVGSQLLIDVDDCPRRRYCSKSLFERIR